MMMDDFHFLLDFQYSIKLALDQLGYPTLHTQHLYESPKILDMWTETVFKPAITAGELTLGHPDFNLITAHGFKAVADLPMAFYFEEIHRLYPDCKFILTTRESSDAWFKSWNGIVQVCFSFFFFLLALFLPPHSDSICIYIATDLLI